MLKINLISLPMSLLLSSRGMYIGFSREDNFRSWGDVKSPPLQRLEMCLSHCWLSLITCTIKSNRVPLAFCLTSLLSTHWPEVMSRRTKVRSMCHFLSTCMTGVQTNQQKKKSSLHWISNAYRSMCIITIMNVDLLKISQFSAKVHICSCRMLQSGTSVTAHLLVSSGHSWLPQMV